MQEQGPSIVDINERLTCLREQRESAMDLIALMRGKLAEEKVRAKNQAEVIQQLLDKNTDLENRFNALSKVIEDAAKDKQPATPAAAAPA